MNYPKLIKQIIDAANELNEEVDDLRIQLGHANAALEEKPAPDLTDLTRAINNLNHTIQNTGNEKYLVLVYCHEYGVTPYLFPPHTKLTKENALRFLKQRYPNFEDHENFYICETDEISCLPL